MKRSSTITNKKAKKQQPVWPEAQEHILLKYFGIETVEICKDFGIRIVIVPENAKYSDFSDYNHAHPFERDDLVRGTYIVCEKTIYLRNTEVGTLVHEMVHAVCDAKNFYLDDVIKDQYQAIAEFVSPYCKHNVCEWHAECVRAYCNAPNYEGDPATRESLQQVDPVGYLVAEQFIDMLSARQYAQQAA